MTTVIVLWEAGFPCVDSAGWTQEALRAAAQGEDALRFVSVAELGEALRGPEAVLVTPYGSAFPKDTWPDLYAFLNRGGSWVNLGGAPLSRPVRRNGDGTWQGEAPQTAYSKALFINQAFPIDLEASGIWLNPEDRDEGDPEPWEWADALARLTPAPSLPKMKRAWSLQVRFTDNKDFPREGGSSGTRDAVLRSQCYALCEGRRLAAPIVVIDRLRGPFAGGRWVLVNAELTEPLDPTLLRSLAQLAAQGPVELEVRPSFACYYPGEQPALTARIKAHRLRGQAALSLTARYDGEEAPLTSSMVTVNLTDAPLFQRIEWHGLAVTRPGLVRVEARLSLADGGEVVAEAETGFWGYDEELLRAARPLTLNRDYFERDGEPYPVMGTTYMAGDTHRKFLFEPNPAVWDRDFAAMKAAGVNMVRTGLWTAWRRVMLDPGAVDEGVLRAFTAFLLTARKHDIPVIFTFFAFLPEEWGGSNPYLDPRAVSAQKELVAAFAHRFAHVNDLMWDFINEPSFSSPARVWSTRPNYDAFERAAWAQWLQERAASFSPEEKRAADPTDVWRERWRLTPNDPLDLPALADFQDQYIFQGTHPLRVLDYRLFAQDMFNRWVQILTSVIRSNGNPHQLITVGQDEGGTGERPNPHFYADVVDFTTNHSWWQNDDLLWDSVMTKTPNKPNLIQETGIMFVENVDGSYRRTPEDCANLLSRKLVLAFAAGCAGAIQWLWNTNIYMDSDNEVGIGFLRADGTEKPELEVFRELSRFFWNNRHRMVGRQLEETVIVIPHSNMFSVRNFADTATRRAVRTLEYDLGVPTRTVSEYRIQDIGDPKFILLPSPRVLTQACWEALLAKVEAGATLLVTGPIDWDEYWRPVPRLKAFGIEAQTRPVTHDDLFREVYNSSYPVHFAGDKMQKVDKAVLEDRDALSFRVLSHGQGQIYYCPLPLELSEDWPSLFYMRVGAFRRDIKFGEPLRRRIEFAEHTLYLIVSETDAPRSEAWQKANVPFGLRLPPEGVAVAFVGRENKEVAAACEVHAPNRKENKQNAKETNSPPSKE
ncbi:MAG TPA: hypothetical protein VFB38_16415 [Chthonomonadaceae bacterium]|nr:hypothetical protein [Chthonomonadaceae bacterium]